MLRTSAPRSRAGRCGRAALLLLLPVVLGCGGQGTVTGRVLYRGKPLPGGRVTFRPADARRNAVSAVIDADGRYEITAPAGEVTILVDNRELQPPPPGSPKDRPRLPPGVKLPAAPGAGEGPAPDPSSAPEQLPGSYVQIPARYHDDTTSGLRYTVRRGSQTHDIELE